MSRSGDAEINTAREQAIERLPPTYATAIRLREAGLPPASIAQRLGVEPEAVGPLLDIADAKLATIVDAAEKD